ncbi:hypothetical protein BD749_0875 [Pontibacter ramchanderi]|uniref:Uncharacterized protein n=1 Tax=Pontibacter ramchanderi TaxID=1179743 RepID=A0A2N3V2S3_9BACT|nr:hypothetical protein BD749_0875 [Pontibacter ramchanderi]
MYIHLLYIHYFSIKVSSLCKQCPKGELSISHTCVQTATIRYMYYLFSAKRHHPNQNCFGHYFLPLLHQAAPFS